MKKQLISLLAVGLLFANITPSAIASGESNCQVVYGGGETCNPQIKFTINKMVQKPGKGGGDFVDNLTLNDPRFSGNQNVNFKIVIENTGNTKITDLSVVDTFPSLVTFVAGSGSFDKNNNTLSFTIGSLEAGKKVEYIITGKTFEEKNLPNNQAVTCVVNNVKAKDSSGSEATDSSQLCIEKNVLGAVPTPQVFVQIPPKSIPATGPEMLPLLGLIPAGITGFYLRRKSR